MGLGWLIGTFAVAGVYGWMMYTMGKDDGKDEQGKKEYVAGWNDGYDYGRVGMRDRND